METNKGSSYNLGFCRNYANGNAENSNNWFKMSLYHTMTPVTSHSCYNSLPYSFVPFLFLIPPIYFSYLHRWNPLSYIYLFHQNFLIHMLSFYFLYILVHSLQNFLFNKHSLKAMHLFTIKIPPSRILVP